MNYSYDDNTKPYKLTGINNQPPTINSNQQTITYNSFNKVETITETDPATLDILRHLSLVYGAGNQRVKQSLSEQGLPTLTKMYVGGIYEKEIVDGVVKLVHYIYSPQGLTAIMERDAQGNDELNYVLTDHLGSVQVLASKTGALIEEYSYDAWGLRRDPGTLEVYTAATGTSVDYGFTGHEHLDAFMMINMNGRMYDPVIGRFISPDPVLQFPNNTQGLNPYSYALNNPLRFVDPSGYSLVGQLLALTAQIAFSAVGLPMVGLLVSSVVMTIDYAIENGRQVMNFSDLSAYFTQSMVISSISMGGTKVIGGTIKAGRELLRALAHATFNGTMRMAQGGKFEHGFLSGFVSSLLGSTINNNMSIGVKVAMSAAIGGTAEALGGGKFANGAVTGAYVMMFNHAMHQAQVGPLGNASSKGATGISQAGLEFIKRHEGFEENAYLVNGKGNPSIGYGHEILPCEYFPGPISEAEALVLLSADVQKAVDAIHRNVSVSLNQNQFDALASYVYNTGSLYGTKMLANLYAGAFSSAAIQMNIITSEGSIMQGLINRRVAEQILFLNGLY